MNKSIFKDKKILFYGPANTCDKKSLNICNFDYIIITNNMLDIFFTRYNENFSSKIIYLTNELYSLNYIDKIKNYTDNIEIILTVGRGYEYLKKQIKNVNIFYMPDIHEIKGTPLGLTRILKLLENQEFKELYISGVTFYTGDKITDCYEDNYITKEGKIYNIFNKDKGVHNISSNKRYTKMVCDSNKNITMCKELHNILYR